MQIFPNIARLAAGEYTVEKFTYVMSPLFNGISVPKVTKADTIKIIYDHFVECLNKGFVL